MNTPNGPFDDGHDDRTMVRPRGAPPAPSAPPASAGRPAAPPPSAAAPADVNALMAGGNNPLVRAATPLLLLGVELRHSANPPDIARLREQTVAQIRRFEARAQAANIPAQTVTAARYVLCTMLDEAVLNAPWGEQSGWSQKTLLVTFHGETYGGAKFFQILDRLIGDVPRHIDLIELMYFCLMLGFAGRYQIEAGGRAKLADIQEDLYRRVRAQRAAPAAQLSPHWRGIEDRRNPVIRYVPFWVIAAAAACLLLGVFLFLFSRLNSASAPISALTSQVGLENVVLPDHATRPPPPAHKTLRELLAPEAAAGKLEIIEQDNGRELVRLSAAGMFDSGGVDVSDNVVPVLHAITAALNQVPGRVIVVGNTDDQPIHSLKFKDNFALSAARAQAVQQILEQGLNDPGRLESSGAGASQPIATPPDLPANRARNRRVDLIYIPEG
ncbi:MAG TPA: type IVB secretion system protein IcmH/DotU [Rhodanobacteraceae bacterium]|nr:type IVB secretion system protein IcmH/DotU [Rhodanobacteraceae bacterium]